VIGASVVYNVTPSLPNGLTIDPLTGSITGTPTAVQILTSYVVIATYTAQSGYRLSSSTGLTRTFKISVVAAELTANVPSQLTYISTSVASSSGNYIVVWGNTLTITNTTPSVIGANVVYSVNPALPSGLTLDSLTGHIVGIPTTNQALTSYVVTATYTAQSGYQLSTATGLTRTIKIYVGSAATITNLTCNATGTGTAIGCTASFPFTCTSSSSCYASQASCYNLSDCIQ
jgi:biotin operon repressor